MSRFTPSLDGAKIHERLFKHLIDLEQYVENVHTEDYEFGLANQNSSMHKRGHNSDDPEIFYFHAFVANGRFLGKPEWAGKKIEDQPKFNLRIFLKDPGRPEVIKSLRTMDCILILRDMVSNLRPDLTSYILGIGDTLSASQTDNPQELLLPFVNVGIPISTSREWCGHDSYFDNVFDATKTTLDAEASPEAFLEASELHPINDPELNEGDHVLVGITIKTHFGGWENKEEKKIKPLGCLLQLETIYLLGKAEKVVKVPNSPGKRTAEKRRKRALQNKQQEENRARVESSRQRNRRTAGTRHLDSHERSAPYPSG